MTLFSLSGQLGLTIIKMFIDLTTSILPTFFNLDLYAHVPYIVCLLVFLFTIKILQKEKKSTYYDSAFVFHLIATERCNILLEILYQACTTYKNGILNYFIDLFCDSIPLCSLSWPSSTDSPPSAP